MRFNLRDALRCATRRNGDGSWGSWIDCGNMSTHETPVPVDIQRVLPVIAGCVRRHGVDVVVGT
jgi:hypothetical protein